MTIDETSAMHGMAESDRLTSRRLRNRIRHEAIQLGIVALVVMLLGILAYAVKAGLSEKGMRFSFSFLANIAGFDISEGWTLTSDQGAVPSLAQFSSDMSVASAFVTGIFNTVKVALLAIVFSTILGTMLGVGRLSTNWVVRNLCFWIVEFVRNTPLLIQLVFWYFAVVPRFPPMASAAKIYGGLIVSQQGIYVPTLSWSGLIHPFAHPRHRLMGVGPGGGVRPHPWNAADMHRRSGRLLRAADRDRRNGRRFSCRQQVQGQRGNQHKP